MGSQGVVRREVQKVKMNISIRVQKTGMCLLNVVSVCAGANKVRAFSCNLVFFISNIDRYASESSMFFIFTVILTVCYS